MNSYERVLTALKRIRLPDRVPYFEWGIDDELIDILAPGMSNDDYLIECDEIDALCANAIIAENKRYINDDTYIDDWGITRFRSPEKIWYPIGAPLEEKDAIASYVPPNPADPHRLKHLNELVRRCKEKKAIIYFLNDAYAIPARLRGVESFMMDLIMDPDYVRRLIDISVDFNCQLAECALKAGADIIASGDDYAFNSGPLISPELFDEFVKPGLAKVVQHVHACGGLFIKHSDGKLDKLLDMVISTGIDCLNPIDPMAGMDLADIKKRYGKNLTLMGNFDCSNLMTFGTPEEVGRVVRNCIETGKPGGGYILSSSNSITSAAKPENFLAVLETVRKYAAY